MLCQIYLSSGTLFKRFIMLYVVTEGRKMDDIVSEVSVVDVYDIASEIGKEFERIIETHGVDLVSKVLPKVINALENLENLAMKNERENSTIQDLTVRITKLEMEKIEKAEDRHRFEAELEQIEEHWREESKELLAIVSRLQDENRKLIAAAEKRKSPEEPAESPAQDVDMAIMQRLRTMVDKQREQIRSKDKELSVKISELETLTGQVDRLTSIGKELRRKHKITHNQVRTLIDERAEFLAEVQDKQREIASLKQCLGVAEKENEDLTVHCLESPNLKNKAVYDLDDPNRPRFTTSELKEILQERNELKARVSDLEDELESFRPKEKESSSPQLEEENTEELEEGAVQGPLPYEPDDAPWKKSESESGIRKFFRKLFSETNISLVGPGPRRSLSTLSKMALSTKSSDTCV